MSDFSKSNSLSVSNLRAGNLTNANHSKTSLKENTYKSKLPENLVEDEKHNQLTRASPTFKERYLNFLELLKDNNKKAIKISVLVIILCVMLVLYFNISFTDKPMSNDKKVNYNYTTSLEYAKSIESKLENLLSKIKGAKDANVMVFLEGSLELIIAEKVDEKKNTTSNGTSSNSYVTTVTEPIILTNGNTSMPLVITEKLPTIKGIVIVCKGASDVMVKMDIINAVRTLFDLPYGSIEVFAGD